jgi:hypothetical protein
MLPHVAQLMGDAVGLDDLKELNPGLESSFRALLSYEDDDFDAVFDHSFTVVKDSTLCRGLAD